MLLRLHEEHERVVPVGAPLAQVGDPADLEIVVPLLTADAARVKPGAPVRVTTGPGSDTLVARVRLVEPAAYTKLSPLGVEEQRVNVIGRFDRPQAGLGDGFRVDARVTVAEVPDAVIVPVSALVRHGEEWRAFVVEAGRARSRVVTLGARAGDAAQVLAGLEPGARVVAYPGERVLEGSRVRF
jgi:HlyD family secretion protein